MHAPRLCSGCGRPIAPGPRERNARRWCSDSCRVWAYRHPGSFRRVARTCGHCGGSLAHREGSAKYCSTWCGDVARGSRLSAPLPDRLCEYARCGKPFQPSSSRQRCCSERCGKRRWAEQARAEGRTYREPWNDRRRDRYHRRRALKKAAATGAPVLLAAIAERDGWRCQLCGEDVNRQLVWPHPMSRSLDHVVPISMRGAHDPANVRLAHLRCNIAKGNRGGGEQLLLFG